MCTTAFIYNTLMMVTNSYQLLKIFKHKFRFKMLTFSLICLTGLTSLYLQTSEGITKIRMFSYNHIITKIRKLALIGYLKINFRQPRFHPTQAFLDLGVLFCASQHHK